MSDETREGASIRRHGIRVKATMDPETHMAHLADAFRALAAALGFDPVTVKDYLGDEDG